ncbi:hypothetical protein LCGC14_2902360, partial [marine sediment metagenome]
RSNSCGFRFFVLLVDRGGTDFW